MLKVGSQHLQQDPSVAALRTRDDVSRYVAARIAHTEARRADVRQTQQAFRRAMVVFGLSVSGLQFYFMSIGVEIMSLPSVTVFMRTTVAG